MLDDLQRLAPEFEWRRLPTQSADPAASFAIHAQKSVHNAIMTVFEDDSPEDVAERMRAFFKHRFKQ